MMCNYIYWKWLVSSESNHWTHQDSDMCPKVDMCQQSNVSSDNFHWTQTTSIFIQTSILLWLIVVIVIV